MNKEDLFKEVSKDSGYNKSDVKAIINSMIKVINKKLLFGIDINIRDFISFKRVSVPARKRRNPKTGEEFHSPKSWKLKVFASPKIKKLIAEKPCA